MKGTERGRLLHLLEQDKAQINDASRAAAIADFKRVAEEYFETDGGFVLTTREVKGSTEVILTFRINRVKNFMTMK